MYKSNVMIFSEFFLQMNLEEFVGMEIYSINGRPPMQDVIEFVKKYGFISVLFSFVTDSSQYQKKDVGTLFNEALKSQVMLRHMALNPLPEEEFVNYVFQKNNQRVNVSIPWMALTFGDAINLTSSCLTSSSGRSHSNMNSLTKVILRSGYNLFWRSWSQETKIL